MTRRSPDASLLDTLSCGETTRAHEKAAVREHGSGLGQSRNDRRHYRLALLLQNPKRSR
jgi:hypothetical protein